MPRRFAIAAALAAALTVAGCGAAQPAADSAADGAPMQPMSEESEGSSEHAESAPATGSAPESGGPESGWAQPEVLSSADASMRRDPGVPGLPSGSGASVDDVLRLGAVANWIDPPTLIGLSLPSASDCVAFAAATAVDSPSSIVVTFESPGECETPTSARTYSIAVPEGVDTSGEIELVVEGLEHRFTLTLPAG